MTFMSFPSLNIEYYCLSRNKVVAGLDEVGRGAIAGPVVASVVILEEPLWIDGVNDSKLLTHKKRILLYKKLEKHVHFSFGVVSNELIDKYGIRYATYLAMLKALRSININPDVVLIDGVKTVIKLPLNNAFYFVRGDQKFASISYASILAKVYRDRLMINLSKKFPMYKWNKNKGYGTKEHFSAIQKYGISSYHRRTFVEKIN